MWWGCLARNWSVTHILFVIWMILPSKEKGANPLPFGHGMRSKWDWLEKKDFTGTHYLLVMGWAFWCCKEKHVTHSLLVMAWDLNETAWQGSAVPHTPCLPWFEIWMRLLGKVKCTGTNILLAMVWYLNETTWKIKKVMILTPCWLLEEIWIKPPFIDITHNLLVMG